MQTSYIVGGIVLLLLIILFSAKYVISDKYTLRDILNATEEEEIAESELAEQSGVSHNFTYSLWIYVNNWNYKNGEYKPIFGKFSTTGTGNDINSYLEGTETCLADLSPTENCAFNPSPVVTFDKFENNIIIYLSYENKDTTFKKPFKCTVRNIPIQKWVNLSFSVYKKTLDVYVNGKLHKTCVIDYIPIMEKGNILITPGGGFDGYTSKFQFYPEALNPQEIWNIYTNGYGSLASTLGNYQVKMSLIENGNVTNSITI